MATWALTCFLTEVQAAKAQATKVVPTYRIDLRSVLGSAGTPLLGLNEAEWVSVRTLWFIDDKRLVATLVTPAKGPPSLASRSGPGAGSPFRLSAAEIEASSGRVLSTPQWPSSSRSAGIVAVNNNGLVTLAGNELALLSPNLVFRKRLELPEPGRGPWWSYLATWSGRHALFVAGNVPRNRPWLWLDTERLEVVKSWQDASTGTGAVSDDLIVMSRGGSRLPLEAKVPGGEWRPISSVTDAIKLQFVGSDLLFLGRSGSLKQGRPPGDFLMRVKTAEVTQLQPPRKGWGLGSAAVARTGKRFVLLVVQTSGFHPALDISGHSVLKALLVFDPPFTAPSLTLYVQKSRLRDPEFPALSPDGRHLAVFSYPNPILEVYDLPAPK